MRMNTKGLLWAVGMYAVVIAAVYKDEIHPKVEGRAAVGGGKRAE